MNGKKVPLADLPAADFAVSPETPGQRVAHEFQRQPELPGVLVAADGEPLGMISREKFLEHLSRPYGIELYMKRPISVLLEATGIEPLQLHGQTGIHEAARIALGRPRDLIYEPIVVLTDDEPPR